MLFLVIGKTHVRIEPPLTIGTALRMLYDSVGIFADGLALTTIREGANVVKFAGAKSFAFNAKKP